MTREEIKQICRIYDGLRAERDAATIAYNSEDTFWGHVLATYNLSRPSLSANLDEAAEEYAWRKEEPLSDGERLSFCFNPRIDAFKAGAEWMAEQGVNSEGKVFTSAFTSYVKTPGIEGLLKNAFPEDTEVIVQIRKKQ